VLEKNVFFTKIPIILVSSQGQAPKFQQFPHVNNPPVERLEIWKFGGEICLYYVP